MDKLSYQNFNKDFIFSLDIEGLTSSCCEWFGGALHTPWRTILHRYLPKDVFINTGDVSYLEGFKEDRHVLIRKIRLLKGLAFL
jgi:hypothetical protein